MEDHTKSTNSNIFNEDIIMSWLPNADEMLKMTMSNKNFVYYPTPTDRYKVFDVTTQRTGMEKDEDDFVAIDQKPTTTTSAASKKAKLAKKTATTTGPSVGMGKKTGTTTSKSSQPSYMKLKVPQTIQLQPDWKVLADFNKQSLEKLKLDKNDDQAEVEDKLFCGNLHKISDDYARDTINPLNPAILARFENCKFFGNISTLEDEKLKAGTDLANVFITDKILSVIMTSAYNSRPWHLKITKIGESIWVDKMESSDIDLVTVNESSDNMPPDDDKNIDSFKNLAIEATLINEFIKEQIIDSESIYDDEIEVPVEGNPFTEESGEVERLMYRYRLWKLGDIEVLVRCQVHAYDENEKGDNVFVNIYGLNEFDVSEVKDNIIFNSI